MSHLTKYTLEFPINSSVNILYKRLSTPSGLSEWFANDVLIEDTNNTFFNVVEIPSQEEGMSGTNVRKEIEKDIEQGLEYFVPKEIITSKDDMQAIEEILTRGN